MIIRRISTDLLLGISIIEAVPGLNFRQRERRAVEGLLRAMLPDHDVILSHNADGKPVLNTGHSVSISHTRGYAAVMLSPTRLVGIDIEYMSDRVERIVERFLRPDELSMLNRQFSTINYLKSWCAKEAAYKYFSEDHLAYFEMRCTPVDDDHFTLENLKRGESVKVAFIVNEHYVLAYIQ